MKRILTATFLLLIFCSAQAQDLIGLHEQKIREMMAADRPALVMDSKVRNETYRYLKYYSSDDEETWIVFIDERGRCSGVRITCDNSCIDRKVRELNDLYKPGDRDIWNYRAGSDEITVRLRRGAYFFTVTWERAKHKGKSGNDRTA